MKFAQTEADLAMAPLRAERAKPPLATPSLSRKYLTKPRQIGNPGVGVRTAEAQSSTEKARSARCSAATKKYGKEEAHRRTRAAARRRFGMTVARKKIGKAMQS